MTLKDPERTEDTGILNGLVLAGGKSTRMGYDKASIQWHGKPQQYHVADMLQKYCKDVFISCREVQKENSYPEYKFLPDTISGLGPYGAILTGFENNPERAWLVIACDLPLLNSSTIDYLIKNRNNNSIATTFESPYDHLPEPLITIWEPHSYPLLLTFLSQGVSCPRKALIHSDVTILQVPDPDTIMNVNTPSEAQLAERIINKIKMKHAG